MDVLARLFNRCCLQSRRQWISSWVVFLLILWVPAVVTYAQCPSKAKVAIQVLGSGGPIADDGRASTAYVVWLKGKSKLLIDAGSGSFLRLGEAKVDLAQLNLLAISHFHTDHAGDVPALLKSLFFSQRKQPLTISGPSGSQHFPSLSQYLQQLFNQETGAYRYLSGYLTGKQGVVKLLPITVDANTAKSTLIQQTASYRVYAMGVPHGLVPTLAYKIIIGNTILVFAGDQNGSDPRFIDFAKGADYLIMHIAVPEDADKVAQRLHAIPSHIGKLVQQTAAKHLILSHFMARSLVNLEQQLALIRQSYKGNIILAKDLACIKAN